MMMFFIVVSVFASIINTTCTYGIKRLMVVGYVTWCNVHVTCCSVTRTAYSMYEEGYCTLQTSFCTFYLVSPLTHNVYWCGDVNNWQCMLTHECNL